MKRPELLVLVAAVLVLALSGCGGVHSGRLSTEPEQVLTLRDFPDHAFDAKAYKADMVLEDDVYVWQDPAADLAGYQAATVSKFSDRLLPIQDEFSYEPYVQSFEAAVREALELEEGGELRLKGALVECNPGSRMARYLIGMGAGKAAVAGVIELFEPGKRRPSLRLYGRDTASSGDFGGDSEAMLNHISHTLGLRMVALLEQRLDGR